MPQRAFLVELDESGSESLTDSLSSSETESLAESVGSVETDGGQPQPERNPEGTSLGRRRKTKKTGPKFMHFSKELRDVPVQATWEFIRDHRMMAALVPGITESFDYIEGNGGTGSVYVATYPAKTLKPGDPTFVMNKVEVSDDASNMHVWRSVGGRYQQRYHLYMTYIKVMPDEVLGDSSSIVVWRFEYELRNPKSPIPMDTKESYMTVMNLVRQRYKEINRVERPFSNEEGGSHSNPRRADQRRLTEAEEQGPETSRQRMGKARARRNKHGGDRESRKDLRPLRTPSIRFRAGGSGVAFRRRPQFCEGGTDLVSTARTSLTAHCPLTYIEKLLQPHLENLQPRLE